MEKNNQKDDKPEWVELVKRFLKKKYRKLLVVLEEAGRESPIYTPFQKRNW